MCHCVSHYRKKRAKKSNTLPWFYFLSFGNAIRKKYYFFRIFLSYPMMEEEYNIDDLSPMT